MSVYGIVTSKEEITATIVGGVTITPKVWKTQEIGTFILNGGESVTKSFTNTIGLDIIIARLSISSEGASAIITVNLPSPHQPETKQIKATIPNVDFNYGEGVVVKNGEVININFVSLDTEAQTIKISYLWTPK